MREGVTGTVCDRSRLGTESIEGMRKRQQRHDIIRDIIRAHNVKTQRDLAQQLQAAGYECTQATISRDIMDMGW